MKSLRTHGKSRPLRTGGQLAALLICLLASSGSSSAFAQDSANPVTSQSQGIEAGGLLSPDLQQRVNKLLPEDKRELLSILVRISLLFAPDPVPDPGGFHSRLHRWETGIKLWVAFDHNSDQGSLKALSAELFSLQAFVEKYDGPQVEFVTNPDEANFWIVSGQPGELLEEGNINKMAAKFFGGRISPTTNLVAGLTSNPCVNHVNIFGSGNAEPRGSIAQALTVVRSDIPSQAQIGCVRRGMADALGFLNDTEFFPLPSWAQRTLALVEPTKIDGEVLRLFYSNEVKPDMDGNAAISIMTNHEITAFEQREGKE